MTNTLENLQAAFAGESQANRKYLAFAKKAEEEGFPMIARLFRAAAQAETVHAHAHLKAMEGVKSTAENLQAAVAGEHYEAVSMYPPMLEQAIAEGDKRAEKSFERALAAEKVHEELYTNAAESYASGKDLPEAEYYVCPVCGYTHAGKFEGKCPICGMPADRFDKVL